MLPGAEMSGLSRPAAAKMSTTPSGAMARSTSWRMAWSSVSSRPGSPRPVTLARAALTVWKKAILVLIRWASSVALARAKALARAVAWSGRRSMTRSPFSL
ncbi:MAG: hypothetical protein AVDCRST_MAG19-3931 [uncultured Thermomicrobiales bacterium]|uniref:Uncharacterized protein n=1 Tax=uncultured Thermomicrobiales bacterium TaxID=1645740 RepID=A0A6J4VLF6_9BACT|nr:MAG: hypothetical protein AVDCRST_MAG19-3931 [uncultured Thermomicrobiales bacterium]